MNSLDTAHVPLFSLRATAHQRFVAEMQQPAGDARVDAFVRDLSPRFDAYRHEMSALERLDFVEGLMREHGIDRRNRAVVDELEGALNAIQQAAEELDEAAERRSLLGDLQPPAGCN